MGASGRGLGGHPRRGPPPGTRYLPGVYASLFGEERLLSMLLSHERARLSLKPCVFPVRVDDLLGKAARGGVVEQGDEPRPPPLASAPRCPPSRPPRALGWVAVITSRGRCPRRRGSCEGEREDVPLIASVLVVCAVLLIAAKMR